MALAAHDQMVVHCDGYRFISISPLPKVLPKGEKALNMDCDMPTRKAIFLLVVGSQ